jgi:hypothetical protein
MYDASRVIAEHKALDTAPLYGLVSGRFEDRTRAAAVFRRLHPEWFWKFDEFWRAQDEVKALMNKLAEREKS